MNLACACLYDKIVQAEAAGRPIARGMAGPGLLAHVLVSKYCDHLPLYRQSGDLCARRSRGWIARPWRSGSEDAAELLEPLVEALRRHVMSAEKLHADDTPVPVLAPGNGKSNQNGATVDLRAGMVIGPGETRHRQRCGSPTRRIARANIR